MKKNRPDIIPHAGVYTRIKPSKIHGVGVVAICDIAKGTQLFADDNATLIWRKKADLKLNKLPTEVRRLYNQFCLIKDKGKTYGCPRNFNLMTIAWYLNHSKIPNVACDKSYRFYALRDIKKDEELTADYQAYNEFAGGKHF